MVEYLFAQGGGVDVRIDFGGGYILMPQHGLDGSQVGPSLEQRSVWGEMGLWMPAASAAWRMM